MQKQTLLDRIEIEPRNGRVFVRLMKTVVDGTTTVFSEPHRFSIEPQAKMAHLKTAPEHFKHVNNHLVSMGFPEMQKGDMATILDAVHKYVVKDYEPPSGLPEQPAPKPKAKRRK